MTEKSESIDLNFALTTSAKIKVGLILGLAVLIWLALGVLPHWLPAATLAKFGEPYAASSALFNSLAIAGVIITILLQSQELRLQRQELTETREELKKSAEAQQMSHRALMMSVYISAFSTLMNNEAENIDKQGGKDTLAKNRNFGLSISLAAMLKKIQADVHFGELPSRAESIVGYFQEQGNMLDYLIRNIDQVSFNKVRDCVIGLEEDMQCAVSLLSPRDASESIIRPQLEHLIADLNEGCRQPFENESVAKWSQAVSSIRVLRAVRFETS